MSSRMSSSDAMPGTGGTGWSWWLPAGTFVAGCALGAVVMGVGDVGGDDDAGSGGAPAAVADSEVGEDGGAEGDETTGAGAADAGTGESPVYVRVPESCAQTADHATRLVQQVDDVVTAVAELDAERLRQAVDDVQQVRDRVADAAGQCQQAAADSDVDVSDTEGEDAQVDEVSPTTPAS